MDYQGNSDKTKQANPPIPEKNLEKVVTGDVVVAPAGIGSKFKRIFFGGDVNTAGQYVLGEVLLPALRNLLVETISTGADRLIYGDSARRRRGPVNYSPRIQYNNPIHRQESRSVAYLPGQPPIDRWAQGRKSFQDVIVATKEDADNVIERLVDVVDMYEVVSVADLYDLLGLPSSHIDNKWGWTHLSNIESRQVREGWKITFPPVEEIS